MMPRAMLLALTTALIVCGLLWRRPELGLPPVASKFGGSIIWGAMLFFFIASLAPKRWRMSTVAAVTATTAALVEFSQLIQLAPLDDFRRTTVGALLIGRTFSWWDIVAYDVGIAVAALVAGIAMRRSGSSELRQS